MGVVVEMDIVVVVVVGFVVTPTIKTNARQLTIDMLVIARAVVLAWQHCRIYDSRKMRGRWWIINSMWRCIKNNTDPCIRIHNRANPRIRVELSWRVRQ